MCWVECRDQRGTSVVGLFGRSGRCGRLPLWARPVTLERRADDAAHCETMPSHVPRFHAKLCIYMLPNHPDRWAGRDSRPHSWAEPASSREPGKSSGRRYILAHPRTGFPRGEAKLI